MTTTANPNVDCEQLHACLPVSDVLAAADFYTKKLGFWLAFTWGEPPTMAGVNLGHVQIFLEHGTPNSKGCSLYFVVGDADELYNFHLSNGVEIVVPPGDRDYGIRDYRIRDLSGYELSFGHRLSNVAPPLKIQRVDVPVRLEKRLAALLYDLAEHKRMSVDSCLEEILLHTCEPFGLEEGMKALERGEGVASPHTKRTIDYIEELKKKHGIDYDCHASYGFVEE
jgi:catechol 2,3-dioxygenase-like lactoylglutathione lyase family enzyme